MKMNRIDTPKQNWTRAKMHVPRRRPNRGDFFLIDLSVEIAFFQVAFEMFPTRLQWIDVAGVRLCMQSLALRKPINTHTETQGSRPRQ